MTTEKGDAQLIQLLTEFRSFRDTEWREFRDQVMIWQNDTAQRVAKLESEVKAGLIGNGTPSRLNVLEDKVSDLTKYKYWLLGVTAGVSAIVSIVAACVGFLLKH
jgi:hypothetical protein